MRPATYTLILVNVILWGYFVWSGVDGMNSVQTQHVLGYPNSEQFEFYVGVPTLMVVLAVVVPILLRRTKWTALGTGTLITTLVLLFPFVFFYTGGM